MKFQIETGNREVLAINLTQDERDTFTPPDFVSWDGSWIATKNSRTNEDAELRWYNSTDGMVRAIVSYKR